MDKSAFEKLLIKDCFGREESMNHSGVGLVACCCVFFLSEKLEVFRDELAVCMDPQHLCNVLTSLYHQ